MNKQKIAAFVVVAVMSVGPAAARGQSPGLQSAQAQRAATLLERSNPGFAASRIGVFGSVWTNDNTPVAFPRLAIRELTSGRVTSRTTGTASSEFRFEGLATGSYVIELWDDDDRVQAVGEPLTVVAGDAVGTFLMVSGLTPIEEAFGGVVSDVVQLATAADVTAVAGGNAASSEQ